MVRECIPFLKLFYDTGSENLVGILGGDFELPRQAINKLDEAVDRAALAFAESTNATTQLAVDQAREATREALRQGMSEGEAHNQLRERIGQIFTSLTDERAYLIAETESARAIHAGEIITARESGLDMKKVWLCDSLACEKCRPLNGQVRELDEAFATIGDGPYGVINFPPAHPACRCTLTYEFGERE